MAHSKESRSPEYRSWEQMKARCLRPTCHGFHNYGGRGITICQRWLNSYPNFLADLGRKPTQNHSLDRVDVNGNYEPTNVRWATHAEQQRNRKTTPRLTARGQTLTTFEWEQISGINEDAIYRRVKRGWDAELAIFAPLGSRP